MAAAAPEPVADAEQLLVGEAGAAVGDDDVHEGPGRVDGHLDLFPPGSELEGVVDDGVERAGERDGVGPARDGGPARLGDPYALLLGVRTPGGHPFGGQRRDVGQAELGGGVLGQRQVQQVVEDLGQALALGPHGGDLLVALGQFEGEQLDPQEQRRERVAQLVGGVGDERPLLLQDLFHVVGHLVERVRQALEFRGPAGRRDPGVHPPGGDAVGGRVQGPYGLEHPAGEPQGGAEGHQHGGAEPGDDQQPAAQDPRPHLVGGRFGDDDRDDVAVEDDRGGHEEFAVGLPGPHLGGVVAAPPGQGLFEGPAALALRRELPPAGGPDHGVVVAVENADPDAVQLLVAGEFELEGVAPVGGAGGPGAFGVDDELGEGGEAGAVVDPVHDHALLLAGGQAHGEREAEGEQHARHEDDEQREQPGAHDGAPLGGGRGDEPVAHPADGLDEGGHAQLGAQRGDVDLEGPPGPLPAGAPHLADDLLAAEDHTGALREQGQQVELLAGERYVGAVHADPPGGQLDADRAEPDHVEGARPGGGGLLGGAGAPGDGVDACEEFTGVVGLDDVVVGAHVEAVDAGADVGARGHHDDGRRGALADLAAHLVAVLVGQAEVQEDDAEGRRSGGQQGLQGLLAAAGVGHLEAVPGEDRGQGGGDVVVVLDEQQSHCVPLSCFFLIRARGQGHPASTPMERPTSRGFRSGASSVTHPVRANRPGCRGAHGAYRSEAVSLCSILPQM